MKLLALVLFLPQFLNAQVEKQPLGNSISKGIQFEQVSCWQQILNKAKEEKKFIFVDCYATWCLPCKKMDSEVFSSKQVGEVINSHFISVRIQMDTIKTDDEYIKAWYSEAHDIKQQYKVSEFPTYLFFSPDGKIVHRYLYALPDSLFLKVAKNALDPERQYYTLLENYQIGKKNYPRMNYLADISKRIGEDSIANIIATDYLHNYLNNLSE